MDPLTRPAVTAAAVVHDESEVGPFWNVATERADNANDLLLDAVRTREAL